MTAQIDDVFRYRDAEWSVAGISGGELFDPSAFELHPGGTVTTGCWRGYQAIYATLDRRLVLADLHIYLVNKGPTINGIDPTVDFESENYRVGDNHYIGLDYDLNYTGGLLLGDGFIWGLYVHMGSHPAWKYERVLELVFENGLLVSESDRSNQVVEFRERVQGLRDSGRGDEMPTKDEKLRSIESAFDHSYERRDAGVEEQRRADETRRKRREAEEQAMRDRREREIEKDAKITERRCPACGLPFPTYRKRCKYCDYDESQ